MRKLTEDLDETTIDWHSDPVHIADGFPGQQLRVLPRPLARAALLRPSTDRLLVTDCGYFPHAFQHGRSRPHGADQAVVAVCTEGAGWCRIGEMNHRVEAGQALVIPPTLPHVYGADEDDPWTIWWLHLAGADVLGLLAAAGVEVGRLVLDVGDIFAAVSLIQAVIERYQQDETQSNLLAAAGAAWHLMALLAADQGRRRLHSSPVGQAQRYLREHLGERVPVGTLAELAGLSPSHFAALFRQSTGFSLGAYQTRLRMARARQLLDTTDQSIAAVATAVGYADPFHFSRRFRAVHQVNPSDYRALSKG